MDEDFWEAGFQYRPNQRLDFELAAGDRSYGNSYRGNFSYELRRGNISASYNEGPATTGEQAFDYQPVRDTDNLNGFIDRPGVNERFISKRSDLNTTIELSKSELTLRMFAEQRELRTTADGTPLSDEEYAGAALRWSWSLGTKTELGFGLDYSERDVTGIEDELRRGQIDVRYQFTQRLSVSLAAMRSTQEGKVDNRYDYAENQIRLMLRTSF
jgi:hypothetical protein